MLIQTLRLKKGWSQQQLAEASGLSTRTVQRIEAGFPASNESLKSLAAVFEVDFSTLKTEPPVTTDTSTTRPDRDREEAEAYRHVRRLKAFYVHLFRYVVFTAVLVVINLVVSPHRFWAVWVIVFWGLAVAIQGAGVLRPTWALGPRWEKEQVEKRLGRPL